MRLTIKIGQIRTGGVFLGIATGIALLVPAAHVHPGTFADDWPRTPPVVVAGDDWPRTPPVVVAADDWPRTTAPTPAAVDGLQA